MQRQPPQSSVLRAEPAYRSRFRRGSRGLIENNRSSSPVRAVRTTTGNSVRSSNDIDKSVSADSVLAFQSARYVNFRNLHITSSGYDDVLASHKHAQSNSERKSRTLDSKNKSIMSTTPGRYDDVSRDRVSDNDSKSASPTWAASMSMMVSASFVRHLIEDLCLALY